MFDVKGYLKKLWQRRPLTKKNYTLDNIKAASQHIGDPQQKFSTVHVAGTSGKGSVVAMVACVLSAAGYKTGAYFSPYVETIFESIQINGQSITKRGFNARLKQLKPIIDKYRLSFFEAKTLLAFDYFSSQKVDIAVIEAGLGGRLDATNVIKPILSVITNIDFDHVELLGNTIAKITREKAGIIKPGVLVVSAASQPGAKKILSQIARDNQAPMVWVNSSKLVFPEANKLLARAVVRHLQRQGFKIRESAITKGLEAKLPGRFEVIGNIILDGAHNPAKIKALVRLFQHHFPSEKAVVLFTSLSNKDYKKMLKLLKPIARKVVTTQVQNPIHKFMKARFSDEKKALAFAKSLLKGDEKLIITGSLYLVGSLRHVVLQRPKIS